MPATVKRMARNGQAPIVVVHHAGRDRFFGQIGATPLLKRAPGSSYGIGDAAALLGIPVSVLKDLRASGHFAVRFLGRHVKCFHEMDLRSFNEKCLAVAGGFKRETSTQDVVELRNVLRTMKFGTAHGKRNLVIAVIEGKITSYGANGDWMGGILLDADEVRAFQLNYLSADEDNTRSVGEAAAFIRCDPRSIGLLAKMGHLTMVKGRNGRRITNASIAAFRKQFVALSEIASRYGTSSKRLSVLCAEIGIKRVEARSSRRNCPSFVTHEDEVKIELHLAAKKQANEKSEMQPTAVQWVKNYLGRIKDRGELLPRLNGKPNKSAIARAIGLSRDIFRPGTDIAKLLECFEEEERSRVAVQMRDALGTLQEYLAGLAKSGKRLPRYQRGQPNKSAVAKACGLQRNLFYRDAKLATVLNEYDRHEPEMQSQ